MSPELSEEEMRLALFGSLTESDPQLDPKSPHPILPPSQPSLRTQLGTKRFSPKLRVTLRASKDFEGDVELLVYEASTLSTLVAEQEAKNDAKKKKFRYYEVVSVVPVQ
ncbi:hypothetical protein EAH72_33560 [Pseudomonas caspiana]|nr:hypothetical protein [Pseudomonas caspiana]TPG88182.1 hypothetical protein EAH72_33560 [Pseudomonas caspiana]